MRVKGIPEQKSKTDRPSSNRNYNANARAAQQLFDYSIEYSHIYTNEQIGSDEHAASIQKLQQMLRELDRTSGKHSLCVMVDDYTFPENEFDYTGLLQWLEQENASPHLLIKESSLIPSADEVIEHIQSAKRKKRLRAYVDNKRYPCSLFVAAWYLGRLGRLETTPFADHISERLINILPLRFKPYEDQAAALIAATRFGDCNQAIKNVYI